MSAVGYRQGAAWSERAELEVQYVLGKGAVEKILQMCAGREFRYAWHTISPGKP